MDKKNYISGYLEGQLLVATSLVDDLMFVKSVIYMLVHNKDGAMGIVINRILDGVNCVEVFQQLNIKHTPTENQIPIHFGGPVESTRGFVLHSNDYDKGDTIKKLPVASMTANVEILDDLLTEKGPRHSLVALGYSSWKAGQLEEEIKENHWIQVPPTEKLIFETDNHLKWKHATELLGFDMVNYNTDAGNA